MSRTARHVSLEDVSAVPVSATGVTKTYGDVRAVSDLSFRLDPGTVTGFLGANGAGKTTTLRMIGGLLKPTAGAVQLFGVDAAQPEARRPLGYMPADPAFLPHLSGHANLDLLAAVRGDVASPDRDRVADTLQLPGRDLDRKVGGYSSGMRQKLAVVAAFQHRPDLVVLDEPANRLDPIAHRAFCSVVRDAAADGRTVLLSSHVLAEVEMLCDSVLLVREGKLLTAATVGQLKEHALRVVTLTYHALPAQLPAELQLAKVDGLVVTGRIPADRPDLLRALLADEAVADITVEPASLEDIVLELYGEEQP